MPLAFEKLKADLLAAETAASGSSANPAVILETKVNAQAAAILAFVTSGTVNISVVVPAIPTQVAPATGTGATSPITIPSQGNII